MIRNWILLASIVAITAAPLSATVGYTESNGNLYSIELESGAETLIGPTQAGAYFTLAFAPSGALFGISRDFNFPDGLYQLDRATGQAIRIGDLGEEDIESLTIDDQGQFWGQRSDALFSLDPTTGQATLAATLDSPVGLVVARGSTLYAISQSGDQVVVETIDSVTGDLAPGIVASPLLGTITGGSFDQDGVLRFMTQTGGALNVVPHGLYSLSLSSGQLEETYFEAYFFGEPIANMQALALPGGGVAISVPSLRPSLLLLLIALLAAAGVVAMRRRRGAAYPS